MRRSKATASTNAIEFAATAADAFTTRLHAVVRSALYDGVPSAHRPDSEGYVTLYEQRIERMGEWDILGGVIEYKDKPPTIVDTGHAPMKLAIDWERKVLMIGVVVQDETGFHAGGFDLPWESAYSIGELLIKMALDLKDGGGTQPR